jgi:hypothetical protein
VGAAWAGCRAKVTGTMGELDAFLSVRAESATSSATIPT